MEILIGKRQQGKTTRLIEMSAAGKGTIVAHSGASAQYIKDMAKRMDLKIPDPIDWHTFTRQMGHGKGPYLLDELGIALSNLGITTATLDEDCVYKL